MNINGEFVLPKRYNRGFMERLNKRENDILERRNINVDSEFFNRPRLEEAFSEEEKQHIKEMNILMKLLPNSIIEKKIDNECVICLSGFKIGDKESTLPCLHIFHYKCLKKWIYENKWCPICKSEIIV